MTLVGPHRCPNAGSGAVWTDGVRDPVEACGHRKPSKPPKQAHGHGGRGRDRNNRNSEPAPRVRQGRGRQCSPGRGVGGW